MIGWYVHHHGHGHVARFLAVQPHLRTPVTAFSSMERPAGLPPHVEWMQLPPDADPFDGPDGSIMDPRHADPTARGHLHWAPHGHPGHRARLAAIAAAAVDRALQAFVVDVSAEVVAFVRLLGLRTIAVTQPGARTDAPHALAYDLADRIVAPWPHGAVPTDGLSAHGDRVMWTGGISRFDGREPADAPDERSVLMLGRVLEPEVRHETTARLRDRGWTVTSIGHDESSRIDDPWPLLARTTVAISAAGQNSVADLAAAGTRAVVIAQERPFDEQEHTATALERWGLARRAEASVQPAELVDLVERAAGDRPQWRSWQVAGAAPRLASAVEAVLP
ncbi:glycosyltransferase [Microbacterium sp. NPDC090007]|uniref:glycosyltransferase n=1 Tax=Microbacterium sp. NPDC090007 TaxID=3364204 RepID=UPI00382B4338